MFAITLWYEIGCIRKEQLATLTIPHLDMITIKLIKNVTNHSFEVFVRNAFAVWPQQIEAIACHKVNGGVKQFIQGVLCSHLQLVRSNTVVIDRMSGLLLRSLCNATAV